PRIKAGHVSTKKLLACKSTEEATILLGKMADLAVELVRMAAEQKAAKKAKKTKGRSTVSSVLEQPTSGVGGPLSPVVSSTGAKGSLQKRQREENLVPIVDLSEGERGFMLP
ncbi:hypothetical protein A2U01_0055225, partial [Trifolium medium]|nr:hypothetical protein [Trifolium medium]